MMLISIIFDPGDGGRLCGKHPSTRHHLLSFSPTLRPVQKKQKELFYFVFNFQGRETEIHSQLKFNME